MLPLPKGEGRGEGEGAKRSPGPSENCGRQSLPNANWLRRLNALFPLTLTLSSGRGNSRWMPMGIRMGQRHLPRLHRSRNPATNDGSPVSAPRKRRTCSLYTNRAVAAFALRAHGLAARSQPPRSRSDLRLVRRVLTNAATLQLNRFPSRNLSHAMVAANVRRRTGSLFPCSAPRRRLQAGGALSGVKNPG